MAVEKLGAPPIVVRRVEPRVPDVAPRFARGLSRVLAGDRPAPWEYGIAIAAIFVLGRYPILFFRTRFAGAFNEPVLTRWQDDPFVLTTLLVTTAVVACLAIRRVHARSVARQPALLAVLLIVWLSVSWSVDPALSARRAVLFVGATAVGWYLADRFSLRDQVTLVVAMIGVALALCAVAFIVWPDVAMTTNKTDAWSGIYLNRNVLAWVLSYGMLATIFLMIATPKWRWPLSVLLLTEFYVLLGTDSKSGSIAFWVALGVAGLVAVVRPWGVRLLKGWAGAVACVGVIVIVGGFVQWHWTSLVENLGRQPGLSGRTTLWEVVRWVSRRRPWEGFGFEAVWANPRTSEQLTTALDRYPYTAHNGYYEFMLGTGRIGLGLLLLFLGILGWQAFRFAWTRRGALSLWPLALLTFAVVMNFSESLFVSAEALWVLIVASAITVVAARPRLD